MNIIRTIWSRNRNRARFLIPVATLSVLLFVIGAYYVDSGLQPNSGAGTQINQELYSDFQRISNSEHVIELAGGNSDYARQDGRVSQQSNSCPVNLIFSNFQTTPNDQQFVDIINAGEFVTDLEGCSFTAFNPFTELSIGAATVSLSGLLVPGEIFRIGNSGVTDVDAVIPNNSLPAGPGGLSILNAPAPNDGTSVTSILPFNVTGMVYLNNTTIVGISHIANPELNEIYDCLYDGGYPFQPIENCLEILIIAPEIEITSPSSLSFFKSSPISVTGDVTGTNPDVNVNGVPVDVIGGSFSIDVALKEGNNIITAVASNSAGTDSDSIQVTLDTTPPIVSIDSPEDGFISNEPSISVSGTINDIVVGTVNGDQAQVLVNGVPANVANRTFQALDIPLVEGPNNITAVGTDKAGNASSDTVTVTYQPLVGEAKISLTSGNNQSASIGQLLSEDLVVQLTDENGNPAPGKTVTFSVTGNNGSLSNSPANMRNLAVVTDAQGQASVHWTLGTRAGAGNNVVEATATGFKGKAIFTATATNAAPDKINVDAGNNQTGGVNENLPMPFIAVVTDAGHNRLANVPVTFEVVNGGGNFDGQSSIVLNTDSDGRALAILTLGPDSGIENNVVEANFPGNTGLPATFVASGVLAGDPADTRVSGVVLDNTDVPIEGVTITIPGTNLVTQSDEQGQFILQPAPVGHIFLDVDGTTANRPGTWPHMEYEMVTVAGQNNTLGMPIYILPLDVPNGLFVDENNGGTLTLDEVPGFSLTVEPGSATFPDGSKSGVVSVTVVHADKIPMVPNFGQQPRFVVTIQPAGTHFDPPAPITIPNVDGLAPGEVTEMYSFDHDLGSFVSIGTGTASEDGTIIASDPGVGIIKGGWHCGGNPAPTGNAENAHVNITSSKPVDILVDETDTVTASGGPAPGEYEWTTSDASIVEITSGTNSASVTIKGKKKGTATLTVKYTCESGASATDSVQVTVHEPEIKLEKVGDVTIESGNNYSENTELKATVVYPPGHPDAGNTVTSFNDKITFSEEAGTTHYDGNDGATSLPKDVNASSGEADITLKSVSNSDNVAGPADAKIKASAANAKEQAATNPLAVDQWVDEDSNGMIDWLNEFADDRLTHFQGVAGIVGTVANVTTDIEQTNSGCGSTAVDQTVIKVSPVCGTPGNRHRLDTANELSDTVIHESRHAWQHSLESAALGTGAAPTNDSDNDHCPEAVPANSEADAADASPIVDGTRLDYRRQFGGLAVRKLLPGYIRNRRRTIRRRP